MRIARRPRSDGRHAHRQTWPIRSKRLRTWLRRRHYQETGQALGAGAIRSALDLLEAQAQFDGPERTIHVRVAEHAGHIYLDLADESWRAVEIGPAGWRVIESPPVRFCRPSGHAAAPVAGARWINRGPRSPPQPEEPQRTRVDRNVATGDAAIPWPVSGAGDVGRARLGEDRPLKTAQSVDRSQCRTGAGARARRARPHDCGQSQLPARVRQSLRLAVRALRRVLPGRKRRELCDQATLYRR